MTVPQTTNSAAALRKAADENGTAWGQCEVSEAVLRQAAQDMDDLASMIGSLACALKRAKPDSTLPARATDLLRRKGLEGSPFRAAG